MTILSHAFGFRPHLKRSSLLMFGRRCPSASMWSATCVAFALFVFSFSTLSSRAQDQSGSDKPTAPKLFPSKTLAYFRIDDTREFNAKMKQTAGGRLADDPQIKPIINEFYSTFNNAVQAFQEAIGVSLDELLAIPNGELALAILPSKERPPFPVLLLEAGDELPSVEILLRRAEDRMNDAMQRTETKVANLNVIQWKNEANPERQFAYFIDQGVIVVSLDANYGIALAKIWTGNGIDHKPLLSNNQFTSILSRCVGVEGERPQLSFYVDPMGLAREFTKNNSGATTVMVMLPVFGIDGIQAVGGSLILAPSGFDQIAHAHLLLENPRRGVLQLIRPKSGPTTPQPWIAEDVGSYMTINWNLAATLKAIQEIYETFRGPDTFKEQVLDEASKNAGIDIKKEFLDQLTGRITITQVTVRPIRINSASNVYAFNVKNPKEMDSETLPKLFQSLKKRDGKFESQSYSSTTIYTLPSRPNNNTNIRMPQVAFALIGDDLLVADSVEAIRTSIDTFQNAEGLLADSLEFKLVQEKMKSQLNGQETSIVIYQRPEEGLKIFYDLAADPKNIQRLRDVSTNNPFFTALVAALEKHQLPPFEKLSKYLSPSGAFVVEEDNGLHYTAFGLQRK